MTWWGAQAWVNFLNAANYGGSNKWALPTTVDSSLSAGFPDGIGGDPPQSSSQMGQLFYGGLGQVAGQSITTTHNSGYALFSHVLSNYYWSGTQDSGNPQAAWHFYTGNGIQNGGVSKTNAAYALAVAPGEVNAANTPAALIAALLKEAMGVAPEGLADKVERAQDHIDATCSDLAGFVNQVQRQNGKKIDPQLATKLIADAKAVETAVGCTSNGPT